MIISISINNNISNNTSNISINTSNNSNINNTTISNNTSISINNNAGKRHPRNHRGFPVAFSNGISHVSGISERNFTRPVDFYWKFPMDFQWHFPVEFNFCDFWCVIFCPDLSGSPRIPRMEKQL